MHRAADRVEQQSHPIGYRLGLEWCEQQSMTLNLDKTKAMLITFGPNSKPPIIVSPIEVVDNWKFLGVVMDKYLNFNKHIVYVTDRANQRFF